MWDDKKRVDLVEVYLEASKSTASFVDTNQVVGKAYQQFGDLGLFDHP